MAQDNDAEISTKFSTLNVNAMEFVPGIGFTSAGIANSVSQEDQPNPVLQSPSTPVEQTTPQPPNSLPLQEKTTDEFQSDRRENMQNGKLSVVVVENIDDDLKKWTSSIFSYTVYMCCVVYGVCNVWCM